MEWRQAAESWPVFIESLGTRWPRAERTELLAIDGDRDRFEAYISETHDLTPAEVREDVEVLLAGALPADIAMSAERDNANIVASGRHIPTGEDVYSEDADFGDDRIPSRPIGREGE